MRANPIDRLRIPYKSRRHLYRHCKTILFKLARPKWRGRAESLKRLISNFLSGRSFSFLARMIRQRGFALLLAAALVAGTATRAFGLELSHIAQDADTGGFAIIGRLISHAPKRNSDYATHHRD